MHCPIWSIPAMPINTNGMANTASVAINRYLRNFIKDLNDFIIKIIIVLHTFIGNNNTFILMTP